MSRQKSGFFKVYFRRLIASILASPGKRLSNPDRSTNIFFYITSITRRACTNKDRLWFVPHTIYPYLFIF
jgi:hypothetical protein